MKKIYTLMLSAMFVFSSSLFVLAVDNTPIAAKTAAEQKSIETKRPARPNFAMLVGTVTKIDKSDPAQPVVEVKDERDGQIHEVEIVSTTNVTKVTTISELKAGDAVRVMAKKVDDKEVAMGIMFGNFKTLPPPARIPPAQGSPATRPAKEMPKK